MVAQRKYPPELQARAVAMYRAAQPKPVIRQMARQLGVHPEALRGWIRKDEGYRRPRERAAGGVSAANPVSPTTETQAKAGKPLTGTGHFDARSST